jgi:hypothetical protein
MQLFHTGLCPIKRVKKLIRLLLFERKIDVAQNNSMNSRVRANSVAHLTVEHRGLKAQRLL